MKYLVMLCDGMADKPFPALQNKTPMTLASKPTMDMLAKTAEVGLCRTVADGLKPGSDVANLSVMGYDPMECYTGRSPLEAASIGVDLKDTDVALRCNLVTLSDEENYADKTMVDYCAGDISTEEAAEIIKTIDAELGNEIYKCNKAEKYFFREKDMCKEKVFPKLLGMIFKGEIENVSGESVCVNFHNKLF